MLENDTAQAIKDAFEMSKVERLNHRNTSLEDIMNRKMEFFINNFSNNIQDIELLKTIYRTAFMDGVQAYNNFSTDLLAED